MACRFPGGANTLSSYWSNIVNQVDCIEPIPQGRWSQAVFQGMAATPETEFAKVGGFVHDIDEFDSSFFGISPREAMEVDPQQRILLELAWRCMVDAAISAQHLSEIVTGVYVGVINHDHERLILSDHERICAHSGLGRSASIASDRISYCFDFSGPSPTIDTACSSSLTAVDAACKALRSGEVDAAFAGGANAILLPESYMEFSQASMLSKSGKCRAFDKDADGFVRAEGGGMILLKRLSDALLDGDRIYSTITASTVNQDGRTAGMMSPNPEAQKKMMTDALRVAGIEPSDIGYIESHGTGTQAGDPVEATALGEVYGQAAGYQSLPVGSVKTNIGHTEAAAGIAGLIKAALAVWHGFIPPNVNFTTPNPEIDFDGLGIHIPVEGRVWNNPENSPRMAAVNSFGFGGANAHVIIQQCPIHTVSSKHNVVLPLLLPLTASSSAGLDRLRKRIEQLPHGNIEAISQLCHTAGRQPQLSYRQAVAFNPELAEGPTAPIEVFQFGQDFNRHSSDSPPTVAFVFNGIGAGWQRAGRELYSQQPDFRSTIDLCHAIFKDLYGISTLHDFFAQNSTFQPSGVVSFHVLQFALQISLAELWKAWGLRPTAVVGHSVGEIAAAYVCGSIDLIDAVKVVADRARIFEQFMEDGLMLAGGITQIEAANLIGKYEHEAFIAAYNSESSLTLSGTRTTMQQLGEQLQKQGKFIRTLDLAVPFHSPLIQACQAQVLDKMESIELASPQLRWYSSVHGREVVSAVDPMFWWRNFRDPVRFAECMQSCIADGSTVFVEVGPHPYLSFSIAECLGADKTARHWTYSLKRTGNDALAMKSAVSTLFNLGVSFNWMKINPITEICDFPEPQFDRTSFRRSIPAPATAEFDRLQVHTRAQNERPVTTVREVFLDVNNWNWLNRHRIDGEIIFPASGYIKYLLEAAHNHTSGTAFELSEIQFRKMLLLSDDTDLSNSFKLMTSTDETAGQFDCQIAKQSSQGSQEIIHAHTKFAATDLEQPAIDLAPLEESCTDLPLDYISQKLSPLGLEGDCDSWSYTLLKKISNTEAFVGLTVESKSPEQQQHLIHPTLLDLCFRASAVLLDMSQLYVPKQIEKMTFWGGRDTDCVLCQIKLHGQSERTVAFDLVIADEGGSVIANISQLILKSAKFDSVDSRQSAEQPAILQPTLVFDHTLSPQAPRFGDKTQSILSNPISCAMRLAEREEDSRSHKTVSSLPGDLTVHHIGRALKQLGFPATGEQYSLSQIEQMCQIEFEQKAQFNALLSMLEHRQVLDISRKFIGGSRDIDENSSVVKVLHDLPSNPEPILEEIFGLRGTWDYTYEIRLIDLCGRKLGRVLTGTQTGISTLFPDGAVLPLQGFYEFSPTCRPSVELLVESVENLLVNWTSCKKCRILELGGGTGALLSRLAPTLQTHPVEYTFTDVSRSFVRYAKERFGEFDFISFQTLDIDASYEAQNISANAYDIVLANDVLHLSRDIQSALLRIQDALADGGRFHFIELTTEPDWAALVFGMLRDWWHKTEDVRQPVGPCRDVEFWKVQMALNGFSEIVSVESSDLVHTIFTAECKKEVAFADPYRAARSLKRAMILSGRDTYSDKLIDSLDCQVKSVVHPGASYRSRHQTYEIRTDKLEDHVRLVDDLRSAAGLPREIIMLWNWFPLEPETSFDKTVDSIASTLVSISHLLKAFVQLRISLPRITLITANVHQDSDSVDIRSCLNATLWSLGRSIRNEFPDTSCRIVDIDPVQIDRIKELCQFILDRNEVLEAVLHRKGWALPAARNSVPDVASQPVEIGCLQPGDLSSIRPIAAGIPQLRPTEILIEAAASALNFRDVLIALNALPEYAIQDGMMQDFLGMECAGKIVRIGDQVEGFSPGDKVIALAPRAMGNLVTARSQFVRTIPAGWSYEQIAGIPAAYMTAFCCLEQLPQAGPGLSVLIHSASGGVGLALINLLRQSGATVYATVGSSDKADFLNLLGIQHVATSRSISFVDDVNEWTCGQGVDLIVNTLAGDLARANAKLLKPAGVFVELGKHPSLSEVHESIVSANPDASIRIVDIDRLWKESPEQLSALFHSVMKEVEHRACPALPSTVFPHSNAKDAFRYMANAKHVGKVILEFKRRCPSLGLDSPISSAATYLVAGGTRGFGLATVQWLSEVGARHIIVVGRTAGQSDQLQKLKMRLTDSGISVKTVATDITDLGKFKESVDEVASDVPPIKGVFHCAMDIDDRVITNLDYESCQTNLRAKLVGAWNLYKITENQRLDFFAIYSSVTSLIGPAGQSAYSAANAFLDSFAKFLRAQGVSATSINWGAVSDYGYVAGNKEKSMRSINRYGVRPLPARSMLEPLGDILTSNSLSQLIVSGSNGSLISDWTGSDLNGQRPGGETRRNDSARPSAYMDRNNFEHTVLSCFSKVLELPMDSIEPGESVLDLGVDSLLAVELSHLLGSEANVEISAADLLQSITIRDIIQSHANADS